jgi:hypothetical protein
MSRFGGWLQAKDTLQILALIAGLVITISTIAVSVGSVIKQVAAKDLVTAAHLQAREAAITRELERRIEVGEALAAQREAALVQRLDALAKAHDESSARTQAAIDRIYNLLLQRR